MKTDLAIVAPETDTAPRNPVARASLAPTTFGEMMRFSEMLANSTFVPKDFIGKPQNVLVAIQWGMEIGLAPMQALQNIAVINGRPSLWGDAALAVVQNHPAYEWHREYTEGEGDALVGIFEIKRKGNDIHRATFSAADAKKAGLWGKAGPWSQYTKRMVCLRARGFGLRDKFADALKGLITAEEAQDYPVQQPPLMDTDMHGNPRPVPPATEPPKPVPAKKDRPKATDKVMESVFIDTIVYKQTANGAQYAILNGLHGEVYFLFHKSFFATAEANKGRTLTLGVSIDSKGRKSIVSGLEPIEEESELTTQLKESIAQEDQSVDDNGDRLMF